jgi:hypothetical protein
LIKKQVNLDEEIDGQKMYRKQAKIENASKFLLESVQSKIISLF